MEIRRSTNACKTRAGVKIEMSNVPVVAVAEVSVLNGLAFSVMRSTAMNSILVFIVLIGGPMSILNFSHANGPQYFGACTILPNHTIRCAQTLVPKKQTQEQQCIAIMHPTLGSNATQACCVPPTPPIPPIQQN
ncbi:MAG: hypothetical protein DLM72_03030 [Candidatus Nitrosopolaris wilkensis]|nr:MAG: hypothetical protein DLM72_03030 [Candidatus Nitrosopolaris wilkensis]